MTYFECFDIPYSTRVKGKEDAKKFADWLKEHDPKRYGRLKDKIEELLEEGYE